MGQKRYIRESGPIVVALALCAAAAPRPAVAQDGTGGAGHLDTPLVTSIDFDEPVARAALPLSLREISGLALTGGRLFAHNDEEGMIVELDPEDGTPLKWMFLGPERVLADFEGIAGDGGRFHLVTSGGTFVTLPEGEDGEQIAYEATETDLGARCEVEGLAQLSEARLLAVCKTNEERELRRGLRIFAFDLAERRLDPEPVVQIPRQILSTVGIDELSPSGIEVLPNGHILVLAARQRILLELDAQGRPAAWVELDQDRHGQPEGIAVTAGGEILIADEGGRGRGRLTRYGAFGAGADPGDG